jgi:putative lipoprotein
MPTRKVTGEIVLPSGELPPGAVTVRAKVEDVSRADAPSVVVGEQVQTLHLAAGTVLPFAIDVPEDAVDERHRYSVSVHVDASGSGRLEQGDLLTTQSYPVMTGGHPTQVRVQVRRI